MGQIYRESIIRFDKVDLDYQIPIWKEATNNDAQLKRITLRDFFASGVITNVTSSTNWGNTGLTVTDNHIHNLSTKKVTLSNGTHEFAANLVFRMMGSMYAPNVFQDNSLSKVAVFDSSTGQLKWRDVSTINVVDGDKGDITVSGGATVWTINNSVVSNDKLANVDSQTIKGRISAGAGIVEDLDASQVRTIINVENGAEVNPTDAEIRTSVEAATDSNVFTDADHLKLDSLSTASDSAGAVLTYNSVTGKIDLGGKFNRGTGDSDNRLFFSPSSGSNSVNWGIAIDRTTGLMTLAADDPSDMASHHYVSWFDYYSHLGYRNIIGLYGLKAGNPSAAPYQGCLEAQTSTTYSKRYRDITHVANSSGVIQGFSAGDATDTLLTFHEYDDVGTAQRQIWQSAGSNLKSFKRQTFDKFEWNVHNAASHNTRLRLGSFYADIFIPNADGTKQAMFLMMPNALMWRDENGLGLTTLPNGLDIGTITGTTEDRLHIGFGEDTYFHNQNTNKRGIKYKGFGETDTETGVGASYATLVGTSLVPKKYVDDAISSVGVSASAIGAGLTYNTTTNKIDLGGVLNHNDSSNAANNVYFTPAATGANVITWGLDSSYSPSGNYIGRFDIFTFSGSHQIHGAFQHTGVNLGLYMSNTPSVSFRQYKDVAQILGTGSGFPGGASGMTYQEFDTKDQHNRKIWESEASNARSESNHLFNEFKFDVYNPTGNTNLTGKTYFHVEAERIYAGVAKSDGSKFGIFQFATTHIQILDGDFKGVGTFPTSTYLGLLGGGSNLVLENDLADSTFTDGTANKKGLKYIGFGETNADTAAGANYSTLVNTSLVPKKYVDDQIAAISSTPTNLAVLGSNNTTVTVSSSTGSDVVLPATTLSAAGVFTSSNLSKLTGIENLADVTDATNVEAAGALMDSEVTNLVAVKNFNPTDYASAGLGVLASNALPRTGGAMTGAITTNSTFDGRDVANDGTKLDTVETNADVTDTANVVAALTAGTNVTIAGDGTISATGGTASPLTTKGDLYGFDTANQRLGVGTNGQALIANSATATGLEWQNLPGQSTGSGTKVLVTGSFAGSGTLQTLAVGQTKIEFDDSVTGGTDVSSEWDNSTHRFTVGASGAGVYIFQASLFVESNPGWGSVHLKKNGTQLVTQNLGVSSHNDSHDDIDGSVAVELAVGDYVEFWANWRTSTGAIKDSWGKEIQTFSITKVGESVTVNTVVLPELTKSMFIPDPIATDDIGIWEPGVAITITKIVVQGVGATSTTFNINHSGGTDLFSSDVVATTTRQALTSFADATCTAANYIQYQASAISGTPTGL